MTKCNSNTARVKDTASFIRAAKLIHGDLYVYEKSVYVKSIEKLIVTCSRHGDYLLRPHNHLQGQGCRLCGNEKAFAVTKSTNEKRRLLAERDFINKANEVHNHKYMYKEARYYKNSINVKITCQKHGVFLQSPSTHLRGSGCPVCGKKNPEASNERNRLRAALNFIVKAKEVHSKKYDYNKTVYKTAKTKVVITCRHHGDFLQATGDHLKGRGCPECANEINAGWGRSDFVRYAESKNNGMAILYIIKCWDNSESFYKIGVTAKSIEERFNSKITMPYRFKVVGCLIDDALSIYNKEIQLHRINKSSRYTPKIPFAGSVLECFTEINQDTLLLLDEI